MGPAGVGPRRANKARLDCHRGHYNFAARNGKISPFCFSLALSLSLSLCLPLMLPGSSSNLWPPSGSEGRPQESRPGVPSGGKATAPCLRHLPTDSFAASHFAWGFSDPALQLQSFKNETRRPHVLRGRASPVPHIQASASGLKQESPP